VVYTLFDDLGSKIRSRLTGAERARRATMEGEGEVRVKAAS
jgi:hypothetical protein